MNPGAPSLVCTLPNTPWHELLMMDRTGSRRERWLGTDGVLALSTREPQGALSGCVRIVLVHGVMLRAAQRKYMLDIHR